MNNFGVFEVASAKTTSAPGWAYVPDTSYQPTAAANALQPTNRKRARTTAGPSIGDLSARQEARLRKEVEALQRDGARDNTIPVPVRSGSRAQGKHSGNVRKILQSQKTFGNHLDDFLAMQQMEASAAAAAAAAAVNGRRSVANKGSGTVGDEDILMSGVAPTGETNTRLLLEPPSRAAPPSHPGDENPLLASRVPEPPTDAELRALLSHPPLTYLEARGTYDDSSGPPPRVFCEVCGYWGRVRCMKCGTRVCALDCLETHREECVTRYGL